MVSVILPNYNHSKYLNQRIESILNQTYRDFELIILDDCSTDDSRNVIDSYCNNEKISHIVFNEKNSGSTFKQWEKGINLAMGNYVWIAESDDFCESNFLASIMAIFSSENIGIAYCSSNTVNESGKIIGELSTPVKCNRNGYYINDGIKVVADYFFFHPIIPNASAVIFEKKLFSNVLSSFKEYKICGDWQFWIDISMQTGIGYLPENLNNFRQSNTSVSRSTHYRKDNFKIFLLEKLKIALHVNKMAGKKISIKNRIKYVDNYMFFICLEHFRKRIKLDYNDFSFVIKSLFTLTYFTPIISLYSLFKVICFALRRFLKTILNIN